MKKTLLAILFSFLTLTTMRAGEYTPESLTITVKSDTVWMYEGHPLDLFKFDSLIAQHHALPSPPEGWPWENLGDDLPQDPSPLIDLSNIKGRWGFEDYYFSGDILHAQARRNGDFYIGGWNIRPLLPRLSGLLVLKSSKKAADKIAFSRATQLRNDSRFHPIVHYKEFTIYAHRTPDGLFDEVILIHASPDSPTGSHVVIIQMMGRLRPDDLASYPKLTAPGPKASKGKR